jgi:phytoene dehydrogenase-like protein
MIRAINEAIANPSPAPQERGLMKFVVHFVPYRITGDAADNIRGTGWDQVKDAYADAVIDQLTGDFLPGLRDHIISRAVQSPFDYERRMSSAVHGTHQHDPICPISSVL